MASVSEHVHIVDIDEEYLRRSKDLIRLNSIANVTFSLGDACCLEFADNSFDTVVLAEVLEHLKRPQEAVSEALRVAARRVVVTVPAHGHLTDVPGHINDFEDADLMALFPANARAFTREPYTFLLYDVPEVSRT